MISGKNDSTGSIYLVLKRKWFILICVLIMAPWVITGFKELYLHSNSFPAINPTSKGQQSDEGPWGTLELVPIIIAPPLEFVNTKMYRDEKMVWSFPNLSKEQLEELLNSFELSNSQKRYFKENAAPAPEIQGFQLTPDNSIVLSLSNNSRQKLYIYLGQYSVNPEQEHSFRFCGSSASEWLRASDFPDALIKKTSSLIYRKDGFLFFSDYRQLQPHLNSPEIMTRFNQRLYAQSTFLIKLHIKPESDIQEIVNYWGRGGRAKDVGPILQSLKDLNSDQTIDIAHLIPQFARRRLYTYPSPSLDPLAQVRDCHWTSLNFFNESPDERFTDINFVISTITNDYELINGNLTFGDLILYADTLNNVYHSAVYIADNIVFTKNGPEHMWPWMFMRIEDMAHFYPQGGPAKVLYYRNKRF